MILPFLNLQINQSCFSSSGFLKLRNTSKPLFVKRKNDNLAFFNLQNWFLQYSEGDKAYRDL